MRDTQKAVCSAVDIRFFARSWKWILSFLANIMLLTVIRVVCQVSPNFGIKYLLLQSQDMSINTLSNFCVFNTTKTRKISIKIYKLQRKNGTNYSCNFNRRHFLHIPSPSARRHICLSTNSSQLGYTPEISSRDPGNACQDDFTSCS